MVKVNSSLTKQLRLDEDTGNSQSNICDFKDHRFPLSFVGVIQDQKITKTYHKTQPHAKRVQNGEMRCSFVDKKETCHTNPNLILLKRKGGRVKTLFATVFESSV